MTNIMTEDLQSHLAGLDFPAEKQAILGHAKHKSAPHDVVAALNGIMDREYLDMADLMEELESK